MTYSRIRECRKKLRHASPQSPILSVERVGKSFTLKTGEITAVKDVSFDIPRGMIFGLLGPNGAGKSTIIKMITQQISTGKGRIRIDKTGAKSLFGLCPQENILIENISVKEHLEVFSMLKIGNCDKISTVLQYVQLGDHADKYTETLSGGNKRKLNVAIALLGDPSLILLDEPSASMDPGAKREMWRLIKSLKADRGVLLTTHSMEEAEALCDELTIVVNGTQKCRGSVQDLKNEFGKGYKVIVKAKRLEEFGAIVSRVQNMFESTREELCIFPTLICEVPVVSIDLTVCFRELEEMRKRGEIVDFVVTQPSIENVFLKFASEQQ